jgi:hypothetical protein
MRARCPVQFALPTLLLALLAGCGASSEDGAPETVTVTEAEPAAKSSVSKPKPLAPAEQAEATVRNYYRAIDAARYAEAWALLSPGLQSELGGFASWRDGYETTISTSAYGVNAIEAAGDSALVKLDIESTDIDECGTNVEQTFSGTWSLAKEGGRFRATSFDVEKISGGEPVLDSNSCGPEEESGEYVPYEEEEASGCDPNYTGCVPESAFDVDCDEVGEEVEVIGTDVYGLDLEEDGFACETY